MDSFESTARSHEQIAAAELLPHEREFVQTLERFNGLPIREMPQVASMIDHTGNVISPDPRNKLDSGIYLRDPGVIAEGENHPLATRVSYGAQPLADLGRKTQIGQEMEANESHHGTFFGMLRINTGEQDEVVPVAIKPIDHNDLLPIDPTMQELAMLEHVVTCGLPTLDVLGVIVENDSSIPRSYILTRRNPQIRSLDTLDWREEAQNIDTHMRTAVSTLTALHINLVFHKDLEFKNISSLDKEGSFIVFDLEWSTSLRDVVEQTPEPDVERLSKAVEFDLSTVRRSMRKLVYPNLPEDKRPKNPQEEFDYELACLYEPYHLAIMSSESKHIDLLDKAYRSALERRRASLDNGQKS